MGELEDKLNSILGNPEAMGQIMALAQSLGGQSSGEAPQAQTPDPPPPSAAPVPSAPGPDLSSLLGGLLGGGGGLDPRLLIASRVMQEAGSDSDQRTALLQALRPFVKEQRYAKLDKAIQIARLSHLIRIALDALKGGENSRV